VQLPVVNNNNNNMATVDVNNCQTDDHKPVSVDSVHLNGQNERLPTDLVADNWGFTLDELYKHALQFYKGLSVLFFVNMQ